MDVYKIINYLPPYALHAALLATVVLSATLVFVFSFRNIGEPPFSEKKSSSKKKRQPKEKKSSNGQAVTGNQVEKQPKSEAKKDANKSPSKNDKKPAEKPKEKPSEKKVVKEKGNVKEKKAENPNSPKEKVAKSPGKGKENVEGKNKRLIRLLPLRSKEENGGWEQAISRKERRARKALLEDPNANYNADGNFQKTPEDKGTKKDKDFAKSSVLKSVLDEVNNLDITVPENEVVVTATSKKNNESKRKPSASVDEPPVGSSTVYDEFAEVFKEPSKKAIKKRVRKE